MPAFQSYSIEHAIIVVACAVAVAAAVMLGRRWRTVAPRRERLLCLLWSGGIVAVQFYGVIWWLLPRNFVLEVSLPLQVCDLVVWTVPFALVSRARWARVMLYFWGLGLSILAFILPALEHGRDHTVYWLFWIGHLQIVGSAVYIVLVHAYRPTFRDVQFVTAVTTAYIIVIVPVNIAIESDYGYAGPGEGPTSFLAPWPWRVGVVFGLELLAFTLLWLPCAAVRRSRARRAPARARA